MVLLLGLQSLNVNTGHKTLAAICSLLLGICGYHITSVIAAAQGAYGSGVWWGFILAGPCGIVSSMYLHPHMRRWFK
jgi:nitrate reductase NapE component